MKNIIKRAKTFKVGKKVKLKFLNKAIFDAEVLERKGSITKVKWQYVDNNGNMVTTDGWFKNKYIIKRE